MSVTAKQSPRGAEYKYDWLMHVHWILGGFFAQADDTLKIDGKEVHFLEIVSYDPTKKIHTISGFGDNGTTLAATATFNKERAAENFTMTSPEGKSTTCRNMWVFSSDRMAVTGTNECDDESSSTITGTKSNTVK